MKQRKDVCKNILIALSIISLSLIIFIGTFSSLFLNKDYYEKLYTKTGTFERISKDIATSKTEEIFLFFEDKSTLDTNFYTENEISHLNDVKNVIKKVFVIYYLSLFILLISIIIAYKYLKAELSLFLSRILIYSGISILIISVLFAFFDFSGVFENFHKILFSENYIFPYSSNMIKMWNEEFFSLFAAKIFLISAIKGAIMMTLGALLIWRKKKKRIMR